MSKPNDSIFSNRLAHALLAAMLAASQPSLAQSEASLAASVAAPSEAVATLVGGAIGAGAGLTLGAVAIVGSVGVLTISTAGSAAIDASAATIEVPLEIAQRLADQEGSAVTTKIEANGTKLICQEQVIAFVPNKNAGSSPRKAL